MIPVAQHQMHVLQAHPNRWAFSISAQPGRSEVMVADDDQGIGERRRRTLSEEDIEAIVEASRKGCSPCPNGLSQEDALELRSLARMIMRAKVVIGNTVLYAIIAGLVVLFYLGANRIRG